MDALFCEVKQMAARLSMTGAQVRRTEQAALRALRHPSVRRWLRG